MKKHVQNFAQTLIMDYLNWLQFYYLLQNHKIFTKARLKCKLNFILNMIATVPKTYNVFVKIICQKPLYISDERDIPRDMFMLHTVQNKNLYAVRDSDAIKQNTASVHAP